MLASGGAPVPASRVQMTALRATGEEFPIELAVVRIPAAGEPMFTGYVRDLTDAKRAEQQLESRRLEAEEAARALSASERQLRALAARVQSASEEERTRIARKIHDELGQQLTALNMDVAWLLRRLGNAGEREPLMERLQAMSTLTDSTIHTVRRIATELRPGVLDDLGLKDAIEWQAHEFQARSGIELRVLAPEDALDVGAEIATALFRSFQEVLTNAARHSHAKKIEVRLQWSDGAVVLEVKDDGRGITPDEATRPASLGLLGMRERAALLGGTFSIKGIPGGGTTVTIRVPAGVPPHEKPR
jgi:signal transduction histidine kinase